MFTLARESAEGWKSHFTAFDCRFLMIVAAIQDPVANQLAGERALRFGAWRKLCKRTDNRVKTMPIDIFF